VTSKAGWGHPQSDETRSKIARSLQKVWVIECIRLAEGPISCFLSNSERADSRQRRVHRPFLPPFTLYGHPPPQLLIETEHAYLKVINLRRFCRDIGLNYRNLLRTLPTAGWCVSKYYNQKSALGYGLRARLALGQFYDIPCPQHSRRGVRTDCVNCARVRIRPDGRPRRGRNPV
jgi:hypothetical protein